MLGTFVFSWSWIRRWDGLGFAILIPEIDNFHVLNGVSLITEMVPMREGAFQNRPFAGGKKEG